MAIDDWARSANYACIVNENIEASEMFLDTCCRALDALLLRHVELIVQYFCKVLLRCRKASLMSISSPAWSERAPMAMQEAPALARR